MSEVDLGINTSLLGRILEVRDEKKWVLVFFLESTEIYTELEEFIFFLYKQDWCSVRR